VTLATLAPSTAPARVKTLFLFVYCLLYARKMNPTTNIRTYKEIKRGMCEQWLLVGQRFKFSVSRLVLPSVSGHDARSYLADDCCLVTDSPSKKTALGRHSYASGQLSAHQLELRRQGFRRSRITTLVEQSVADRQTAGYTIQLIQCV